MFRVNFNAQVNPAFTMLSQDQIYQIHLASLEILEHTGALIESEKALVMLKEAGCLIKGNLVRFPGAVVKKALASAPERAVLANTEGKRTVYLENNAVNFGALIGQDFFFDTENQETRKASLEDAECLAKVAEGMEYISFISSRTASEDAFIQFKRIRKYTKKPILQYGDDAKTLELILDLAVESAGGAEELKRNPNVAVCVTSDTPLSISEKNAETLMLSARYGVPVVYNNVVIPGVTGPGTLAGSVAVANAGVLCAAVVHQLTSKGAPFVMGISAKEEGDIPGAVGGPDAHLVQTAAGHLARFYKVPSYGKFGATDACTCDQQAALEATFSTQCAVQAGTNFSDCAGTGDVGSLEYLIMVNEIIGMINHFYKGVEISEETVPMELIHEVGHGGNFLLADHTMKHYKSATFYPRYMNRQHFLIWEKEDGKNMLEKLVIKARKILKNDNRHIK